MVTPVAATIAAQVIFFLILFFPPRSDSRRTIGPQIVLPATIIVYFLVMGYFSIERLNALAIVNMYDFATYNQTFWNTVQGRIMENTAYGSNLACHSTLFYFLLMPLYYIAPYPHTLLIIKILLFALSAIPFYLIARNILKAEPPAYLIWMYLLFPYLVTLNFHGPHEMGYAPFFMLWTFYFFQTGRFRAFMAMLLLTLSIKEHLALFAVMLGIYAFIIKKERRWIIAPIAAGVAWGILSIVIIHYFQSVYHSHRNANWYAAAVTERLRRPDGNLLQGIRSIIAASSMMNKFEMLRVFSLMLSTGIILPFLSPISIVGLPELAINLLSLKPRMFIPLWHYNYVVSCFLILGAVEGIRRLADAPWMRAISIEKHRSRSLISVLLLSIVILHDHALWVAVTNARWFPKDKVFVEAARTALSRIPPGASVTIAAKAAILISRSKDLYVIGASPLQEYVIVDLTEYIPPQRRRYSWVITPNYKEIFRKERLVLYQRSGPPLPDSLKPLEPAKMEL